MAHILVVEDDAPIADMYRFKLEQSGYQVTCAANGEEGLESAEKILPDLILLDLRMPVMTGEEMLAALRASEWGYNIPVAVLTNISKQEVPPHLRFLHVDRYIVKAHHTPAQVAGIAQEIIGVPVTAK